MVYQKYLILIKKLFKKQMTADEAAALEEWLSLQDEKDGFDALCHDLWIRTPTAIHEGIETEMLENIKQRIPSVHTEKPVVGLPFYRAAVVVLCMVCMGLGWYAYQTVKSVDVRKADIVEAIVENGQKAHLILPDGTKVWLNSATQLTYDGRFNDEDRKVKLNGEAYFEVAKNKDKRFVVECDGLTIEALGTAFNVKAYGADSTVTTSLMEGSVRVSDAHSDVVLQPNQSLAYTRKTHAFSVQQMESRDQAEFWRKNILYFDATPLSEIAKVIERMYDVKVVFENKELEKVTFSGTIKNNSIGNIFHVISFTYPLKYEFRQDTVYLNSP